MAILNLSFKNLRNAGRLKCCGMADRRVVANGCRKTKKIIWHGRGKCCGSWLPALFASPAYLLILFEKLVGELCKYLQEGKIGRSPSRVIWILLGGHSYLDTLPRSNIRIRYVSI